MKKMRTVVLVMMALLIMAVPVGAASQKTAARKAAENYLKGVKTMSQKKMEKYALEEEADDEDDLLTSILVKTIRKNNKKYFSYKIKSVTVSADQTKASVKVAIKYRSLYKAFYNSFLQTFKKVQKLAGQGKEMSEKQLYKDIGNRLKKNLKKYSSSPKSKTLTLKMVKTDAGWKFDSASLKNYDPFLCDMMKGLKKAEKKLTK